MADLAVCSLCNETEDCACRDLAKAIAEHIARAALAKKSEGT